MSPAKSAKSQQFEPKKFLATIGEGGKVVDFANKQKLYSQGDSADAVFYIEHNRTWIRFGLWLCLKVAKRQR
jgi:hypothetical protein